MSEVQLRQWVEANPERVNGRDNTYFGLTPLITAVSKMEGLSMVVWLLDEKSADVNATIANGNTPLHLAKTPDIVAALLDRGADSALVSKQRRFPLMHRVRYGNADVVARLLQDQRVRATINVQDGGRHTALYHAFTTLDAEEAAVRKAHLLLQAGADPISTDYEGRTPLDLVRQHHPNYHAAIALIERTLAESEKVVLLVKTRRLAVAAVAPPCFHVVWKAGWHDASLRLA